MKTTREQVINHMIGDRYYNDVLVSYLSSKSERDEFRQELWMILLEMPEVKLIDYYDRKCLKYIYIGIINNQIKSSTSPWHKKWRMNKPNDFSPSDNLTNHDEFEFERMILNEKKLCYIEKKLEYLELKDPYLFRDIQIFKMHFYEKLSYRKIEKKIGVSYMSVWKYVNNIIFLLKKDINEIKEDDTIN